MGTGGCAVAAKIVEGAAFVSTAGDVVCAKSVEEEASVNMGSIRKGFTTSCMCNHNQISVQPMHGLQACIFN